MALDKILSRMHEQINELAPTLELFVEESIQPSVADCNDLQQKLANLQESLAVYKHQKQEKELSPSFNIHAKVSEKKIPEDGSFKKETPGVKSEPVKQADLHRTESSTPKVYPPMTIGINDKFRFINELFKQNNGEYNIAIEQLNALNSWHEAELYLNSLKMIYNWKDNSEIVVFLYSQAKKRFAE
jgi:hypothetical protein